MAAKKKAKGDAGGKGKSNGKGKPEPEQEALKRQPPAAVAARTNGVAELPGMEREYVQRAEYFEDLPVAAELHERDQAGVELAKLVDKTEALKTEKREALAGFKDRKSSIEEDQKKHAAVYHGMKLTKVKVTERLYTDTGMVDTVRLDTGEVIRSRVATKEDLQEVLDGTLADRTLDKLGKDGVVSKLDKGIAAAVAALPPLKGDKKPDGDSPTDAGAGDKPSGDAPDGDDDEPLDLRP
jgi:hypothetical protein